jgi:hypothetical protein
LPSEHVEGSHCGWSGPREGAAQLSIASRALPPGASRGPPSGFAHGLMAAVSMLVTSAFGRSRNRVSPFTI